MILKSCISKINFYLNRNPKIRKCEDPSIHIPEGYKSVLLISADFELAWAWRYAKGSKPSVESASKKARIERNNIPKIVKLCETHQIPVTWLTVGHLFLENCEKNNGLAHANIPRLAHFENDYWKFSGDDWFEHDPCTNVHADPEWYCPDLIKMIVESPVEHEIGCHTFSHIDCRDGICPPDLMQAELRECKKAAARLGLKLRSFVHPGFTIGNLNVLAAEGFTNFRTDYRNVLGFPQKHSGGLWEFEQTAEFALRPGWSIDYHIYRYRTIIERAIKSNTVCVLWFHPSFDPVVVDEILPDVFGFIDQKKSELWVTTHTEYVDWLNTPPDPGAR